MSAQNADQQPSITVFRGWDEPGKYVWSPYVIKLEARLRFAGVNYTTEAGSLKAAPKGKIPYIEYRDQSSVSTSSAIQEGNSESKVLLGDSALIAKTLSQWGVLPDLNGALDPSKHLHDMALIALLENKLYFYSTWERWIQHYYEMRDHTLWAIPYPIRVVVGLMVYRKNNALLHAQGTGRFTAEEISAFQHEIWGSLNALLVASRSSGQGDIDEPFWVLGGHQPTEADTCLFGFIISALICTAAPDSQKEIRSFPGLLDYAGRIHDRYFPDYEKWVV